MKSLKSHNAALHVKDIFFYGALLFSAVLLITSCRLTKNIKQDKGHENVSEEIDPSVYNNLFFSGARIDSIDKIMSRIYSKRKKQSDTIEDGSWSEYARWRSFWITREGKRGEKKSYESYLKALSILPVTDICDLIPPGNPATWKQLGPFEGPLVSGVPQQSLGAVFAVAAEPNNLNVIYVGTGSAGIWKTTNGQDVTPVWKNITDNLKLPSLGISDIVIDPTNNNVVYAAASNPRHGYGMGILKSTNAGVTWQETGLVFDPIHPIPIRKLLINPNNSQIIYVQSSKKIYRSSDGGATWPAMNKEYGLSGTCREITSMEFNLSDPNVIYITGKNPFGATGCTIEGNEIWEANGSTDQWTRIDNLSSFVAPSGFPIFDVANLCGTADGCYAMIIWKNTSLTTNNTEIKKYNASTNTWQSIGFPSNLPFSNFFVVNPQNPSVIYVEGNHVVGKTINGGQTTMNVSNDNPSSLYMGVSTHGDIRAIKLLQGSADGKNDMVLVGTDGGVLLSTLSSTNNETIWKNINGKGLAITEYFGISNNEYDPFLIHAGAQDNGLSSFDNNSLFINVVGDGYDCLIDADNESSALGQYNYPGVKKL